MGNTIFGSEENKKTQLTKSGCLHSMGVFSSSVSSPLFKTWCTAVQWSNKEILPIPAPSTSFLFFSLLSPGTYRGELILHFKRKIKKQESPDLPSSPLAIQCKTQQWIQRWGKYDLELELELWDQNNRW